MHWRVCVCCSEGLTHDCLRQTKKLGLWLSPHMTWYNDLQQNNKSSELNTFHVFYSNHGGIFFPDLIPPAIKKSRQMVLFWGENCGFWELRRAQPLKCTHGWVPGLVFSSWTHHSPLLLVRKGQLLSLVVWNCLTSSLCGLWQCHVIFSCLCHDNHAC